MHVCTEHGRVSDFLHHSLMMSKDKIEVTGKILNLTLEIIFLLTGEDFVLRKRQNDESTDDCQLCLSEGSTKDRRPSKERPCPSPAHEETPEPGETPHTPDEEIPVRCEDVAVFFSKDEWKYLEGHKESYKNVVSRNPPPPGSPDCGEVEMVDDESGELDTLQVDAAPITVDAPLTGGQNLTKPPESSKSPPVTEKCLEEDVRMVTQEYQALSGIEISPPQCKEEDEPVEISSGDHGSVTSPEISVSPVCIEGDTRMTLQEYQAEIGDVALLDWCKEEPDPRKIRSGLPTTWKVQPETPHLLIPLHHKNGLLPTNLGGNTSRDCSSMAKPKAALHEAPPLRSKTNLPNLIRKTPHIDASSSNIMTYGGGAVNIAPILDILTAHKCQQCGRSFRNETDLISHQRTHEKMYHCALCQQSFMDKSALVVHEWTYHIQEPKVEELQPKQQAPREDRPFSCLECGKSFMKKSSLVKHQRIHTGAFACPDCGKCLSDKTGLIIHRRTHTGEKPFSCSECGRRFTQMCHLITHQSVHTGKKSFACSDCGKCFSIRSVLEAHQALHNRHRLQRSELMAHAKDSDSTA
ncbi:uncharacterized protein ACNLHF_009760 [Anomaloglossus baeobatrachus]|uniref:uncharacterized protein LOC142292327 n=1 Tax=Anomaloglossus baeobatrachus TaxID=238106 RepID=UPI003F4F796F